MKRGLDSGCFAEYVWRVGLVLHELVFAIIVIVIN